VRQQAREWLEELACRAGLAGLTPSARRAAWTVGAGLLVVAAFLWGRPAVGTSDAGAITPAQATDSVAAVGTERPAMPTSVTVHVVGAVARPGVYALATGARCADAVAAAGGLLGPADQSAVNLARVVTDGEQIVVPVVGEAPANAAAGGGAAAGGSAKASGGKVDLNTATVADLDTLPGVGPATAAKIIADREENGPFRTPEDLMRVPGIGAKRFESLKDLVSVR
jgi:competence protein ComEA